MESGISGRADADNEPGARNWFVYGEPVLDWVLKKPRAEFFTVYTEDLGNPTVTEVRSTFNVGPHLSVDISNDRPRIITNLDTLVMYRPGKLHDLASGEDVSDLPTSLELQLRTFELRAEDIIRLNRLHLGYPEIVLEEGLAERLAADMQHLSVMRSRFDELGRLFLKYQPIARWRVEVP